MSQSNPAPIQTTSRPKSSLQARTSTARTPTGHPLARVTAQLDSIVPHFEIDPDDIQILDSPTTFYETLKAKIRGAKRRIYLSTLYIGTTENELVESLQKALENNPSLELSILTDMLRGTREDPDPSCATLLAPLVSWFGDRVRISMFHTPNLYGWKKKYMPKRINEGWGLQHMKLYGFDDEIILSGANLSHDYFTNRLDRYYIFSSKELTEYYSAIHHAICDLSFQVMPSDSKEQHNGFELLSPCERGVPDPIWNTKQFQQYAKESLDPLIHRMPSVRRKRVSTKFNRTKTFVYPVAQFDVLLGNPGDIDPGDEHAYHTSTEKPMIVRLLNNLIHDKRLCNSTWTFTAGYFNIDPEICKLLVAATPSKTSAPETPNSTKISEKPCTVITASPWANGFYGSAGVSGMLPAAYTHLSSRFLDTVSRAGKTDAIQLKEWRKGTVGEPGGMTYHAKGIWVTLPPQPRSGSRSGLEVEEPGPSITLVGSSNYNKRSYSLDLEIGAMIVTGDERLKARLKKEKENLEADASVATLDDLTSNERRPTWKVMLTLWLVEALGAAL